MQTSEQPHLQSIHTDSRTISPSGKIHTTTRTSPRLHFSPVPWPLIPSGCFQRVRRTDFLRNNTTSHEGHIPDPHSLTNHGKLPAPGKTAGHLPHCSPHDSKAPRICTHSRNYTSEGLASAYRDPADPCIPLNHGGIIHHFLAQRLRTLVIAR